MRIRTEFSGVGNYGICFIMQRAYFDRLLKVVKESNLKKEWENIDLDGPGSLLGIGGALVLLDRYGEEKSEVKIGMVPRAIEDAVESASILFGADSHCEAVDETKSGKPSEQPLVPEASLAVRFARATNGWCVRADFTAAVWNVIESLSMNDLLPAINADQRKWWEDQSGLATPAQYTTVFTGRRGRTIQVYQPKGNGLLIAGSRQTDGLSESQITDRHTDTAYLAFGHIISLCTILKHCRLFLGEKK